MVFDEVPGSPKGFRVLLNMFAGVRRNMTLGFPDHLTKWELSDAFREGRVEKSYLLLCEGDPGHGEYDGALGREGRIARLHEAFYTTTGNGTPVESSIRFGREIAAELRDAGVQAVLLSGT